MATGFQPPLVEVEISLCCVPRGIRVFLKRAKYPLPHSGWAVQPPVGKTTNGRIARYDTAGTAAPAQEAPQTGNRPAPGMRPRSGRLLLRGNEEHVYRLGDTDLSADKYHYRLCTPELELFGEDGEALSPCHLPRSRALGVRRGGATSRACSRSAACTATRPAWPTCAARSPLSWAPSTLRSATPHPGMWSPLTSASGAMYPRTASIRRCSRAAVHAASGLEGLERQLLVTGQARVLPGRGGSGGHRLRTQGAVRRDRRAGLARRSGGHVTLARRHRRRKPYTDGPVRDDGCGLGWAG